MAATKQTCFFVFVLTIAFVSVSCCSSTSGNNKPGLDENGCTRNQTYLQCNYNCPNNYCPRNDDPLPVCDPPPPEYCQTGCHCRINYRLNKLGKCILASECPPIRCTRKNEVYDSCPEDCRDDRCEARNDPPAVCNTLLLNCQPSCVCRKGTWRNSQGICVEPCECDV